MKKLTDKQKNVLMGIAKIFQVLAIIAGGLLYVIVGTIFGAAKDSNKRRRY